MREPLASDGFDLLEVGPSIDDLFSETVRRTGSNPAVDPRPEVVAEFFAGVRVDLTFDEALTSARSWKPQLIISETCDLVGPIVGAALLVPTAKLAYGPALPAEFSDIMSRVAQSRFTARSLTPRPPAWHLDTCPPAMQPEGWQAPSGHLGLRPEPHTQPWRGGTIPERSERQRILVSFGTVFSAPHVLSPILEQLLRLDVDLVVTLGLTARAGDFTLGSSRLQFVQFTPLALLLEGVSCVVTHGGAGTTLGTLARGIPLVVLPQGADQFLQAERVAAAGAGIALDGTTTPAAVAAAAQSVLTSPRFKEQAARIQAQIAAMPSPSHVASELERR